MDTPSAPDHERIPEALVLAAVRRATLHRIGTGGRALTDGAPLRDVAAHLGIRRRSARAAALRAALDALEERDLIVAASAHGVALWRLTAAGGRRLDGARQAGEPVALPESPQHLAWRRARTAARAEIGRLGADLRDSLEDCERLLARLEGSPGRGADSDTWFALADRLRRDCRRVGAAWHCLREWPEPEDARADYDDLRAASEVTRGEPPAAVIARRAGRRGTRLWDEPG
jgi:hypothetical protein